MRTLGILLAGILQAGSLALGADSAGALEIRVIDGANAVYPLGSRATRGVTILVTDASGHPVDGATVSFSLPADGPGGVFATGVRTEIATTKPDGKAAAWGMRWNRMPGQFELRIQAMKGPARAQAVIVQELTAAAVSQSGGGRPSAGSGSHKVLWISLAVGAAAAGIAGAGLARSSTPAAAAGAAPSTGIQIGLPTITVGRP